jgi:hypothetical protein
MSCSGGDVMSCSGGNVLPQRACRCRHAAAARSAPRWRRCTTAGWRTLRAPHPATIHVAAIVVYSHFKDYINHCDCFGHRLSINRLTKRGKEKSPSDGHSQCEKEMDDH